ncbi:MAG: esterase family protein [Pyrinomonadaceae bacterium]|nr:esterase family protein [Pyrinomonadaceae bacterium]
MLTRRLATLIINCFCVLFFASDAFAQEAAARATAGKLLEVKVSAPALKGNLLGDPTEQSVAVYLPPSYDTSPTKRFPTLYLLHGFLDNKEVWTTKGFQGMRLQPLMDEMIKSGKIREMVVVVPNGWNASGGAFYTNSSVTGNWEDYIHRDLVQNIDANYRTIARPESRGIAGHSMGGYGAITLAMKHPDVFSAVYALSPCCLGMEGDFTSENPAWLKTIRLTSREQLKSRPESLEDFYPIAFVAVSAAFSPNPEHGPFDVDFPYQEREGRLEKNESAYARWRSKMPLYMVEENKQNLLKLRGIFIDYGVKEEFSHVRIASQLFSKALAEQSIPHIFEVYEGNHGNKIRQRVETRVLQFFSNKLEFESPK